MNPQWVEALGWLVLCSLANGWQVARTGWLESNERGTPTNGADKFVNPLED